MIPASRWTSAFCANNFAIEAGRMSESAKILDERVLAQGRFALTRTRVEVTRADGAKREIAHEIYRYGPAAAVLLYDPQRRVVTLVRQFRLAAFLAGGRTSLLEVCAGMLDGDAPKVCAAREAMEETGVAIANPIHAFDAFMSPGGMTEMISCFVAPYGPADRTGRGGGVDEDEDIEVVEIAFAEALAMIERGDICDAKTVGLLYYAAAKGLL
jgi:nudix-type nucleoside diphosphatase (YffH/AdpP family)